MRAVGFINRGVFPRPALRPQIDFIVYSGKVETVYPEEALLFILAAAQVQFQRRLQNERG